MATVMILLFILALGALSARGHTADSRDSEYGLAGLVGTATPADGPAAEVTPTEVPVLRVPAAWLARGEQ